MPPVSAQYNWGIDKELDKSGECTDCFHERKCGIYAVKAASDALEKYGDTRRLLIVRRSESGAEDTVGFLQSGTFENYAVCFCAQVSIAPNELVMELYRGLRETLDGNALKKFANEQQTDATVVKRVLEYCAREALPTKQTHPSTASKVLEAPKSAGRSQVHRVYPRRSLRESVRRDRIKAEIDAAHVASSVTRAEIASSVLCSVRM